MLNQTMKLFDWVVDIRDSSQALFQITRLCLPVDNEDVVYPYIQLQLHNLDKKIKRTYWNNVELPNLRQATETELATLEKTIKWKSIGRNVGEFLVGDIVSNYVGKEEIEEVFLIRNKAHLSKLTASGENHMLTLVCPVEKRLNF